MDAYNNLHGNTEIIYKKTVEKDHGRIEEREYYLCYNISKIKDKKWKTIKAIAYIKASRTYSNETITTENYYIIDYQITIEKLILAIRNH